MGDARRLMLAGLTLAVATGLCGSVAHADPAGSGPGGVTSPSVPGQRQIDQAKAAVAQRQSEADRLRADLAAADQQARDLDAKAGLAAEAYDAAVERSTQARRAAATALARLDAARAAQSEADSQLGSLAAAMYRQGPDIARLAALLHIGSLREFTDREQALRKASESSAGMVRDAQTATAGAQWAQQQAQVALTAQEQAERDAQAARVAAQQAAADEQRELARIRERREAALSALAGAQGVQVELERQRQQALAEAAARAAAAAQAEQAARASQAAQTGAAAQAPGDHGRGSTGAGSRQGTPPALAGPIPYAAGPAHALLAYVYAQLGKPYVWGGAGPDVFDCSGLAMRGLEAAGWNYPHPAQGQYLAMHPISYADLRPGDLVFWATTPGDPYTIYHEAIAIGGDRVIQAPRPGRAVEVASLWANGTPSFYARP